MARSNLSRLFLPALPLLTLLIFHLIHPLQTLATPQTSLLSALAESSFSFSSSTPIPISTLSVHMKALLSNSPTLPQPLSTLPSANTQHTSPVTAYLNALRLDRIRALCATSACNINEADPVFGTTPLHIAAASNDAALTTYLLSRGANLNAVDAAGRKPANLTYDAFIPNSKKWARAAGRHNCDLPQVVFPPHGAPAGDAVREARRLVSEGEPVLLRGALRHFAPALVDSWRIDDLLEHFGRVNVTVGSVPYAAEFDLEARTMSLGEYYERFVRESADGQALYVFDRHSDLSAAGYQVVADMVRAIMPVPSLIVDPEDAGGVESIHFFLGRPGSGAPFHIHADAVNAVVAGSKRWFVYTPKRTLYSRTPIQEWIDGDYSRLSEAEKPLECIQEAGDVVYVPLDWGHAVVNLEENTFGYSLELLNKRDTLARYRPTRAEAEAFLVHEEL